MTGRSRFRFRFRGVMSLVKSIASQFFDILQKEEAASNTNVFYDPADLTSLRVGTDGSGGNPSVGDPVGIMMDTSQFGGKTAEAYLAGATELVTNGTFDTDTSGWTSQNNATLAVVGGQLTVTGDGTSNPTAYQAITTVANEWYEVVGYHDHNGVFNTGIRIGTNAGGSEIADNLMTADGTYRFLFQATGTTTYVSLRNFTTATNTAVYDNISVKEIPGHHAIAPDDNARPVLFDDPDLTAAALTDNGRGEELIADQENGWIASGNWSFSGGTWTHTSSGGGENLRYPLALDIGAEYEIEWEQTGDWVSVYFGSLSSLISNQSGNHTKSVKFRATVGGSLYFRASSGTVTVSNISIRKVLTAFDERGAELWNTPTISDPAVWQWDGTTLTGTGDGTSDTATGDSVVAGDFYEVSWTANRTSASGLMQVRVGLEFLGTVGVGGTSTYIVQVGAANGLSFTDSSGWEGTITNITCKRVPYPNLVTNGTFDTDSDWTKGTGWSIGSGKATATNAASTVSISQANVLPKTGWYKVQFYVSDYSAGAVSVWTNTYAEDNQRNANGWYTEYIFGYANEDILFKARGTTTLSIDNVSVQELPASIDRKYYLDTDGSDDWMEVKPTLNLGEQWWHVGAWKYDAGTGRAFATSSDFRGALRSVSNRWFWYDSAGGNMYLSNSGPETKNVVTIEQSGTNSISARYNGVQEIETQTPYDDSGATQGFALFSHNNLIFGDGLDGRFYGGSWGQGQVDYDELTVLQDYLGTTTQPPIDPPDVTEYADVYELLAAQTGAVLFDIDDTTSLRVGRDGSGGVPVDGDPVGMMLDVSDTGGQTMAAFIDQQPNIFPASDPTIADAGGSSGGYSSGAFSNVVVGSNVSYPRFEWSNELTVGAWYYIKLTASTTGGMTAAGGNSGANRINASGDTVEGFFQPATASFFITTDGTSTFSFTLTEAILKEIPSHAAIAPSDSARPNLATENSPISSREVLTTTFGWNITDGGRA